MMDHLRLYWTRKDCDLTMKKEKDEQKFGGGGVKRYGNAEEKDPDC